MNRTQFFIFFVLWGIVGFSREGFGQIVPEKTYSRHSLAEVWGRVSDTSRLSVVPLAHVFVMDGKDTVKLVTDLSGRFFYKGRISDTLQVQVTALGFKSFSGYYMPKKHGLDIRILLQQESVALNEVIVTGKSILMVVKGDTLQYHTDAVKTLVGDKLGEILKKLPGVNMKEGLKVNGVPIQRIYVNGDTLFKGLEALDHIEAENVKGVKMFDERNKQDLAQGLKYGRREKVMDVATKREVSRDVLMANALQQKYKLPRNTLRIGGGMDASRNRTSEFPEKFLLNYAYRKGNGLIDGVDFLVNYSNLFLEDKRELMGSFNYGKRFDKISYYSRYQYFNIMEYDNQWEEQDYFPTDQFEARRYEHTFSEKRSSYGHSIVQGFGIRIKGVQINLNGQYSYRKNKNEGNNNMLSTLNEKVMAQGDVRNFNRQATSQKNVSLFVSRMKKKNTFQLSSALNFSNGERKGWQQDILETSSRYIDLNRDWDTHNMNWKSIINITRVLSPLFKMSLEGEYNYSESSLKGIGENAGVLDTNNTRNYTFYNSNSRVDGTLSYYGKKVEISGGGVLRYQSRNQVERFPAREQIKNHFLFFEPNWKMRVTLAPTLNLRATYKVKTTLPSDIQLRREIDDVNPLYLSSGNPNLKLEKEHSFMIQGNKILARQSSALEASFHFTLMQDPIVSNSRYFTETEYLPEYSYTVEQGATLNTYENSDPGYHFFFRVSYEKFWSSFGKVIFVPRYEYRKTPSFTQGEKNDLTMDGGGLELRINTNFSKKVRWTFFADTEFSRLDSRYGRSNNSLRELITCDATTTIIPKYTMVVSMRYSYRKNFTTHQETNEKRLNASISRTFGKNFSLELKGENLLDWKCDKQIGRTAQYEYRRDRNQTGRYVTLQFSCKF